MKYPLIVGGETTGEVTVCRDGLFTLFEAALPADKLSRSKIPELAEDTIKPLRLSVYGGGREGYLGVMIPWQGGLFLRKKLSKAAMRDFPMEIEYAAPSGQIQTGTAAEGREPVGEAGKATGRSPGTKEEAGQKTAAPIPDGELSWFKCVDGSLRAFDGKSSIIALPAQLRRNVKGTVVRRIDGRTYMLFRY